MDEVKSVLLVGGGGKTGLADRWFLFLPDVWWCRRGQDHSILMRTKFLHRKNVSVKVKERQSWRPGIMSPARRCGTVMHILIIFSP